MPEGCLWWIRPPGEQAWVEGVLLFFGDCCIIIQDSEARMIFRDLVMKKRVLRDVVLFGVVDVFVAHATCFGFRVENGYFQPQVSL